MKSTGKKWHAHCSCEGAMRCAKEGTRQISPQRRRRPGRSLRLLIGAYLALCLPADASTNAVDKYPAFYSYQTHTHLRFPVDLDTTYRVERLAGAKGVGEGLRVVFKNAARSAFAKDGVADLSRFNDGRTARVRKSVNSEDVVFEIRFTDAAARKGVDYFDYRNRAASEVLIDYWVAGAEERRPASAPRPAAAKAPALPKAVVRAATKGAKASAAAADQPEGPRTCASPLKAGHDVLLSYKVYHRDFTYGAQAGLEFPDSKYEYPAPPAAKQSEDKQGPDDRDHYALALLLAKQKKLGLVLRTIDFFEKGFKQSPYEADMRFLKAAALLRLGKQLKADRLTEQGGDLLGRIIAEEPLSVRGRQARLYLLARAADQGNAARILDLSKGTEGFSSEEQALYLLASAEAQQALRALSDAEALYAKLAALKGTSSLAPEGAYRLGEIKMEQGDYAKAKEAFIAALRAFPDQVKRFPAAVFNLAETYYRLGERKNARELFLEFRARFPHDPNLWAAELRIPEIDRMEGGADAAQAASRYESLVNRHPYSPGAFIAELRLAECADPEDARIRTFFDSFFKRKDLEKQRHALLDHAEMLRLSDLSEIRYLNAEGEHEAVLPFVDKYRDRVRTLDVAESFLKEFRLAVTRAVSVAAAEGRARDAVSFDENYGDFAGNPKDMAYEIAVMQGILRLNRLQVFDARMDQARPRFESATPAERDELLVLDYERARLLEPDRAKLQAILKGIADDGARGGFKYDRLAQSAVEAGEHRLAVDYDSKLLEEPARVKQLSRRAVMKAALRRMESLQALKDYPTVLKVADRFILRHGAATEHADVIAGARSLRARALFETGAHLKALAAIEEVFALAKEGSEIPRKGEFEFMRAKCLDHLSRDKEATDAYRKLAASDKGMWGKSAKAELDHKEFTKNSSTDKAK